MKVKIRPLNKGELFPCTLKRAKELFEETAVILDFAHTGRTYVTFANTPSGFYLKNEIKGIVIASMYMYPGIKDPLLSFFVLKKTEFTFQLQDEFENKYLPEFYNFYHLLSNAGSGESQTLLVELIDGKLRLHRVRLRQFHFDMP